MKEDSKEETPSLEEQMGAFAGVLLNAVVGAQQCQTAYIGHKLGWYNALQNARSAGLTPSELAGQTKTSTRYAQEWLEHQAVSGWIRCENPKAAALERRFVLPDAHAAVLANADSLFYSMPLAILHGGSGKLIDEFVEAYRNDTGVTWSQLGDDVRMAQAAQNRPFFLQKLPEIMEEILGEDMATKLKTSGGRIADIGAGYGWSSVGVAKHFPAAHVDAYDLDAPSIAAAHQIIAAEGLDGRVHAHCVNAANTLTQPDFQPCDLVMALECIHDLGDPISVLRTMRGLAGGVGRVIVMDEKVAEDFATGLESHDSLDHVFYGFSCMCCLADCKSHPNGAETGTVMRPAVLRTYAQQAGFRDVQILSVDHDFFRFYDLIG